MRLHMLLAAPGDLEFDCRVAHGERQPPWPCESEKQNKTNRSQAGLNRQPPAGKTNALHLAEIKPANLCGADR